MSDPTHPPRNRPPWLQATWRACFDVGIALGIGIVLSAIGFVVVPAIEGSDRNASEETMRVYEWELKTRDAADPRARGLAAELRELHPDATVSLETRDGTVWLVSNLDRERTKGRDPLVESGLWTGKVNIPSAIDVAFTDPTAIPGRSPLLAAWMLSSSGLGFLIAGLWLGRRRLPSASAPPPASVSLGRRVLFGVGVGVTSILAVEALGWLLAQAGAEVKEQAWVTGLMEAHGLPFYVLVVVVVAVAPIGEELFFRRLVFGSLVERGGRGLAYGLSAWFFAVVHLNPTAVPAYLLYGLAFAWAYERTGSVIPPIVAHALVNTTALVLLALP